MAVAAATVGSTVVSGTTAGEFVAFGSAEGIGEVPSLWYSTTGIFCAGAFVLACSVAAYVTPAAPDATIVPMTTAAKDPLSFCFMVLVLLDLDRLPVQG